MSNHPGGKFVINQNIGRDISKFFHGGYSLENTNGSRPHTHTNVARKMVNSMIVARLDREAPKVTAIVKAKHKVNSTTATFEFKITEKDKEFKVPSLDDYSQFGRHYLLMALDNQRVKRHYTLSSVMKPSVLEKHWKAVDHALKD